MIFWIQTEDVMKELHQRNYNTKKHFVISVSKAVMNSIVLSIYPKFFQNDCSKSFKREVTKGLQKFDFENQFM